MARIKDAHACIEVACAHGNIQECFLVYCLTDRLVACAVLASTHLMYVYMTKGKSILCSVQAKAA